MGRVLRIGDLAYHDKDKFPKGPWCKEGDYVCYGKHTGTKFLYKGIRLVIMYDDQRGLENYKNSKLLPLNKILEGSSEKNISWIDEEIDKTLKLLYFKRKSINFSSSNKPLVIILHSNLEAT